MHLGIDVWVFERFKRTAIVLTMYYFVCPVCSVCVFNLKRFSVIESPGPGMHVDRDMIQQAEPQTLSPKSQTKNGMSRRMIPGPVPIKC